MHSEHIIHPLDFLQIQLFDSLQNFIQISFFVGISGVDFWYSINAICDLYGLDTISDEINLVVQSAFQFALTDRMSLNDKDLVQVITSIDGSHGVRSLRTVFSEKILYPLNETVLSKLFASPKESFSDVYISVEVRTWSPSLHIAEDVRTTVIFLSLNIIRMLHLQ